MFDILISDDILDYVEQLLEKYNFGQRGYADGNQTEQRTGLIGQTYIQEIFGFGRPTGEGGFDNGIDFIFNDKKIDVKTMGRTVKPKPDYVNNFIGLQKSYESNVFIFCSYNKKNNILTICGWITKTDFFIRASFYPKGTLRYRNDGTCFETKTDLYEIENNQIHDVFTIDQLIKEISSLQL